jgi:hypothetical protein
MLTVIVNQIADQLIRMSTSDDTIELTEFEEELEEEIESEDKLASIQSVQVEIEEIRVEKSFITISKQLVQLNVYKKIPVPPPELG